MRLGMGSASPRLEKSRTSCVRITISFSVQEAGEIRRDPGGKPPFLSRASKKFFRDHHRHQPTPSPLPPSRPTSYFRKSKKSAALRNVEAACSRMRSYFEHPGIAVKRG